VMPLHFRSLFRATNLVNSAGGARPDKAHEHAIAGTVPGFFAGMMTVRVPSPLGSTRPQGE
jgi:hypothetical protein